MRRECWRNLHNEERKRLDPDNLAGIPAVCEWLEGACGFRTHLCGAGRKPRPDSALLGHWARNCGETTAARLGGRSRRNGRGRLEEGISENARIFPLECLEDASVFSASCPAGFSRASCARIGKGHPKKKSGAN